MSGSLGPNSSEIKGVIAALCLEEMESQAKSGDVQRMLDLKPSPHQDGDVRVYAKHAGAS